MRATGPSARPSPIWQHPGIHSGAGRLSDARFAGRRTHGADRQPGAEPVHQCARLALRRGHLRSGSILVFIPALGAYLTPDLLGGGRTVLIGNLVQNQFTNARDWPFGAAISVGLMALVGVLVLLMLRSEREGLV